MAAPGIPVVTNIDGTTGPTVGGCGLLFRVLGSGMLAMLWTQLFCNI
jgi:hypothetical protein